MKRSRTWLGRLILLLGTAWSLSPEAAVIKSVQSNVQTMPVGATFVNVVIASVTPANAFVICQFESGGNGSNPTDRVTCELTGATTLTITNGANDGSETVSWYVVEFFSGVTVQRGLQTIAAGSLTAAVPIAAVNLAKTFVLTTVRTAEASQLVDEQFTVLAQLTSTTNLQLTRTQNINTANGNSSAAVSVAWQVIQIQSAVVQSGTATIPQNQTVNVPAVTLAPPVDTTRTFLVFTSNGGANNNNSINGDETLYQVTGEITNSTTLTFTRGRQTNTNNTLINIAWFAVRMTDGTTVQRGTVTPAGAGTATVPIALAAITINRSVPILSARVIGVTTPTADLDDSSWAGTFTTTTNLQISKNASNTDNSTIAWQVVQFNDKPNRVDGDGREVFP
jgi:hypothetical protein